MRLSQLSRALRLNRGYLSRLSRTAWWPPRGADGGWDPEACRIAIAANVRSRSTAREAVPAGGCDARPTDEFVRLIEGGCTDPVEIAKASVLLAARRVAAGVAAGRLPVRAIDDLKRALEECRRTEEQYLDLAKRRGELIERTVACAVAGALGGRLVNILNNVENTLATQVEIWMGDQVFGALPTEARGREIRGWFDSYARALRACGADEIEAMVATEAEEQGAEARSPAQEPAVGVREGA